MNEDKTIDFYSIDFISIIEDKKPIPDKFKSNIYFENDIIRFENLTFIDSIQLNHFEIQEYIYFENCTFKGLKFKKLTLNQWWFKNCIFNESLLVDGGFFNDFFWFQDCLFKSNFIIRNGYFENFFFNNSEANKEVRIEGGNFKRFSFIPKSEKDILKINGLLTFINELELTSNNGIKIIAEKTVIKNILCKGYLNSNSRIDFNDIKNNFSLEFNNVKNDGKIYLNSFLSLIEYSLLFDDKNINIIDKSIFGNRSDEYLKLINKTKAETVIELYNKFDTPKFIKQIIIEKYFSEITKFGDKVSPEKSFFKIINSSIGYIELIDFDIDQYKNINIESSDLSSIKLINSFIPIKKNRITSNDNSYLNHYSIYNNLYISAKNQNNIKDRNKYFQASQKYLLKNLKTEWFKNLSSIISNSISNLFSNYGQSWIKSSLVTIILSIIMYGFYLISHNNIFWDISFDGIKYYTINYLKFFPEFLNPTHKTDFIIELKNEIGNWSRFIDFFSRIIVGIGIFETIKSYRKYVT